MINKNCFLASLTLATLVFASDAFAKAPTEDRVNLILGVANMRIEQQIDVWFEDGDFPADISALAVQQQIFPSDYEVATNLGWMQENIDRYDDALVTYERFRTLNPNDPDSSLPEADFFFRTKAYDKVAGLLEPAIHGAKHPHPNAYRILAHSYERRKLFADAKRVYLEYLTIAPNDGAARLNLARVEKRLASGS